MRIAKIAGLTPICKIGRIDGFINGAKQWDQRMVYDSLGRLSTAAEYRGDNGAQAWATHYDYDRYGNRFQYQSNSNVAYTPVQMSDIDASTNRFINSGSTPTTYDPAGNITQDTKFRGMNYAYDANGRQISASSTYNDAQQTSVYDCAGQRVRTSANGVARTMVYDIFGQLVADYLGSSGSTLERENIYRGGQLVAVYETGASCYKSISQFVSDFYQGALGHAPSSTDQSQWENTLTQAQSQGRSQLTAVAQNLGTTLFTSTEYVNRNRTNSEFVTDLYAGYLGRSPDSGGYNDWMNALNNGYSRDYVRHGFAYSLEFQNDLAALCVTTSSTGASIKYVLSDAQGTTRAVMNNNGSSSTIIARHDYLPFGEEIWSGTGLRTAAQGYGATDAIRQKYGLTERDDATGLDHTWWRKYENFAGRWTSPDPYNGSASTANPQSFNRYAYVQNDPVNFVDPTGLELCVVEINITNIEFRVDGGQIVIEGSARLVCYFRGGSGGSGGGGVGGGGPAGGGPPQKPVPQPHPSPSPDLRSQQAQFDDCAKQAYRSYRKTYLKTSGKAIVGGAGVGLGLGIGGIGYNLAGHALADTTVPILGRIGTAAFDFGHIGMIGIVPYIFGGKMALDSISEATQNSNRTEAALSDCRKRYPNANHSLAFLNF